MGVDIATHRARIGNFYACTIHHILKGTSIKCRTNSGSVLSSYLWCGLTMLTLCWAIIEVMLIIGGIEPNPGPKKHNRSKKKSTDPVQNSDSKQSEEAKVQSSQQMSTTSNIDDTKITRASRHHESLPVHYKTEGKPTATGIAPNSTGYPHEERKKTCDPKSSSIGHQNSDIIQGTQIDAPKKHGPDANTNELSSVPSSEENQTVELPLLQMVGQDLAQRTTDATNIQKVAIVQEVFNVANVQKTAVNINVELSHNTGPIQFGQTNVITTKSDSESSVSDDDREQEQKLNPVERHLRDIAQGMITENQKKYLVNRKGFNAVLDRLKEHHAVVITGIPGEGKTSLALEVMKQVMIGTARDLERKVPIKIDTPGEWKQIISKESGYIVLIDDIFGKISLNKKTFDDWEPILDTFRVFLNSANVYVIITLRIEIFNRVRRHLDRILSSFTKEYKVDLSGKFRLTRDEKYAIIEKNMKAYSKIWNTIPWIHDEKVLSSPSLIGFSFVCYIFFAEEKLFLKGKDFFLRANKLLLDQIENMYNDVNERGKYFTLVYTWLNNNNHTLDLDDLDPFACGDTEIEKQKVIKLQQIAKACGIYQNSEISTLRESAEQLADVYLAYDTITDVYSFFHSSVMEAVFLSFGKMYPRLVLSECDESFIMNFVAVDECHNNEMKVKVRAKHFDFLARRVYDIMKTNHFILNASFMRDKAFVDYWFKYKTNCKEDLTSILDGSYHSGNYYLIECALERGAGCTLRVLLEIARGHFASTNLIPKLLEKTALENMAEALHEACLYGNKSIASTFLQSGARLTLTHIKRSLGARRKRYFEMLKYITDYGADWSTEEMTFILKHSLKLGLLQVVQSFQEKGVVLKAHQIETVCRKAVATGCVEVLEHFYKPDLFLTKESIASLIDEATKQNHVETIPFLARNGLHLTHQQVLNVSKVALQLRSIECAAFFHFTYNTYNNKQLQVLFDEAIRKGDQTVAKYFHQHNLVSFTDHSKNCLTEAFSNGYFGIIRYFHNEGIILSHNQMSSSIRKTTSNKYIPLTLYFLSVADAVTPEHMSSILDKACENDEIELLKLLEYLGKKLSVKQRVYLLEKALLEGKLHIANYMFKIGKVLNFSNLQAALAIAFRSRKIKTVKILIQNGARLERDDVEKLLSSACRKGKCDVVLYLHKYQDAILMPEQKEKILKCASNNGNLEFIQYFHHRIQRITTNQQVQILNMACLRGYKRIVSYFHRRLECLTSEQMSQVVDTAVNCKKIQLVRFLHYYKVPLSSEHMSTSVDAICSKRKFHMIKYLHQKGAVITSTQYSSILRLACNKGSCDIVSYLNEKVSLMSNEQLQLALSIACARRKYSLIRYLHEKGAILSTKQLNELSDKARDSVNLRLIRYLLDNGVNFPEWLLDHAFYEACIRGKLCTAKYFQEKGASINTNERRTKAVDQSIRKGFPHMLKYLHELGAEFTPNQMIKSLQITCSSGTLEMMRYFCENDFTFDKNVMTKAIDIALQRKHYAIMKYLRDRGAKCSKDQARKSLLEAYMNSKKHFDMFTFLIQSGEEFTPALLVQLVAWACQRNNLEMVKFFHKCGADLTSKEIVGQLDRMLFTEMKKIIVYLNDQGALSCDVKTKQMRSILTSKHISWRDIHSLRFLHEIGTSFTPLELNKAAVLACNHGCSWELLYFCENGASMLDDDLQTSVKTNLDSGYLHAIKNLKRRKIISNEVELILQGSIQKDYGTVLEMSCYQRLHINGMCLLKAQMTDIVFCAFMSGDVDVIKYFLNQGVLLEPFVVTLAIENLFAEGLWSLNYKLPMLHYLDEIKANIPPLLITKVLQNISNFKKYNHINDLIAYLSLKLFSLLHQEFQKIQKRGLQLLSADTDKTVIEK